MVLFKHYYYYIHVNQQSAFGVSEIVFCCFSEELIWRHVMTSGNPPSGRDSHTCSSWRNKLIVIGGEDSSDCYLSDVYVLDTGTCLICRDNPWFLEVRIRKSYNVLQSACNYNSTFLIQKLLHGRKWLQQDRRFHLVLGTQLWPLEVIYLYLGASEMIGTFMMTSAY